jgi:AmmeMemoRadiSam system protein B
MNKIRKPAVAGLFYPASKNKLEAEIQTLLSISNSEKSFNNIFGIVVPHAGYIYSGRTASYAFNLLKDKEIKTVIIISPSHREYFPGISIYDGDGYETPLGIVEVDKDMTEKLTGESRIIFKGIEGHMQEHAIEVQIPFLQFVLKDFKIVPIVMGDQGDLFVDELSEKLSITVDDKTIVIASSDLSHYYSDDAADKLDSIVEKRILDFDFDGLRKDFQMKNCEACGGGAIVSMMKTASVLNRKKSEVLNRSNSGDITGERKEVVGYLSAVIYGD